MAATTKPSQTELPKRLLAVSIFREPVLTPTFTPNSLLRGFNVLGNDSNMLIRLMKLYELGDTSKINDFIDDSLSSLTDLFLGTKSVFSASSKSGNNRDVEVQYLLILFTDLAKDSENLRRSSLSLEDPYAPLLPLLKDEEPITRHLAADLVTDFLETEIVDRVPRAEEPTRVVFSFLADLLGSDQYEYRNFAASQICKLLRSPETRSTFWSLHQAQIGFSLNSLLGETRLESAPEESYAASDRLIPQNVREAKVANYGPTAEWPYWVGRMAWQITLREQQIAHQLQTEYNILNVARVVLRRASARVSRVFLATLVNVLCYPNSPDLSNAVLWDLGSALPNLDDVSRQVVMDLDEEARADCILLQEALKSYADSHTTLDEYADELLSGQLRWSPPHRSSDFWDDHAQAVFDFRAGALVAILTAVVQNRQRPNVSRDEPAGGEVPEIPAEPAAYQPDTQYIAFNDLLHIVRRVPEAKARLERYEMKTRLTEFLGTDAEEGLRYACLELLQEWYRVKQA